MEPNILTLSISVAILLLVIFFFYLFPWLGCTIAVLFIVLGIVVIRVMIKYERSQNVKK